MTDIDDLALLFANICSKASIPVMEVYTGEFTAEQKADRSPVTAADKQAEDVILEALAQDCAGVPVIAEESFANGQRPDIPSGEFILVDPVDGTKEFINKNGEFTINIGLVRDRQPVAGAVFAPARQKLYWGGTRAHAKDLRPDGTQVKQSDSLVIRTRNISRDNRIAVMSRSHADEQTQAFAEAKDVKETISAGSSLKFCVLAEGRADLYPRFGPTMEWDTAAGHAVLKAAGGLVTQPDGSPFLYEKTEDGFRNGAFIAWANPDLMN